MDGSDSSTSISATCSEFGATSRQRRARATGKRPQRAQLQEALRAVRRKQREDTVLEPLLVRLLSPERYRIAQQRGRLHLPRGNSIRGIRADKNPSMHTSSQFVGDTPLWLVAIIWNLRTACDGSALIEGDPYYGNRVRSWICSLQTSCDREFSHFRKRDVSIGIWNIQGTVKPS